MLARQRIDQDDEEVAGSGSIAHGDTGVWSMSDANVPVSRHDPAFSIHTFDEDRFVVIANYHPPHLRP